MGTESKILIVDDQKANRLSCEYILEDLNIDVYHADSGKDALSQILHHDFAVILMDVNMPELDGYETTRLIRNTRRYQDVPIVMVTANDQGKSDHPGIARAAQNTHYAINCIGQSGQRVAATQQ